MPQTGVLNFVSPYPLFSIAHFCAQSQCLALVRAHMPRAYFAFKMREHLFMTRMTSWHLMHFMTREIDVRFWLKVCSTCSPSKKQCRSPPFRDRVLVRGSKQNKRKRKERHYHLTVLELGISSSMAINRSHPIVWLLMHGNYQFMVYIFLISNFLSFYCSMGKKLPNAIK